jgi:hypothetical protein
MPPRKKITDGETPKPKREKKSSKHQVVAVITPDGIQGTFQPDVRRPLIAHLPIHSSEIQFHVISMNVPYQDPYDWQQGRQYLYGRTQENLLEQ